MPTAALSDSRARRNIRVLVAAQVVLGSQMPVTFILGGLAGQMLAPTRCLATLPISVIILGSMLAAPMLADLMQRRGRRLGFVLGAAGGGVGSLLCAIGLVQGSFALFLAGSFASGLYMSAQGFYRFAATDGASAALRPKAISMVMGAGLASAVLGPQLVKQRSTPSPPCPSPAPTSPRRCSTSSGSGSFSSSTARPRLLPSPTARRPARGSSSCGRRGSRSR